MDFMKSWVWRQLFSKKPENNFVEEKEDLKTESEIESDLQADEDVPVNVGWTESNTNEVMDILETILHSIKMKVSEEEGKVHIAEYEDKVVDNLAELTNDVQNINEEINTIMQIISEVTSDKIDNVENCSVSSLSDSSMFRILAEKQDLIMYERLNSLGKESKTPKCGGLFFLEQGNWGLKVFTKFQYSFDTSSS